MSSTSSSIMIVYSDDILYTFKYEILLILNIPNIKYQNEDSRSVIIIIIIIIISKLQPHIV